MNKDPFCVVCRDLTIECLLCNHTKGSTILICPKCFDETKDNWFKEPWKVMPETLEASSDALKLQSSDS